MILKQQIKKKNLYREYLKTINGIVDLPQREIDVLSLLMKIDDEWKPRSSYDVKDIISTDNRKFLMRETRINKNNLTKYINILKRKGLIISTNDSGYEVYKEIMPKVVNNKLGISFILELIDDES
jgi:hypothetical protein